MSFCCLRGMGQQMRIYNGIDVSHHNNVCWDSVLANRNIKF